MDLAPTGLAPAPPLPTPAIEATLPTSIADLDRAAAELAERAQVFARTPPREKAAILRATIARIAAVAPEMATIASRAAGIDAESARAGEAWIAGPVALIAGARSLAEALEDIAMYGRPSLPASALHDRIGGRLAAQIDARSFVERALYVGREVRAIFEEGVEIEDAIAGQAAFYRSQEPASGVVLVLDGGSPSAAPLAVLHALFVEGRVALLETSPARAWLGSIVERAFAPLIEAGFVRVVQGGDAPGAHLGAHPAVSAVRTIEAPAGGSMIVLPALYALDELWFVARRLASELAMGATFALAAPRRIVVGGCWAQRGLFVDQLERAFAMLPSRGLSWTIAHDVDPKDEPLAGTIGIVAAGCEDAVEMLSAAVDVCNASPAAHAELVVHPVQEEDREIGRAIQAALVRLRAGAVGINAWPALLPVRGIDARMLARVDKVVVQGPLRDGRRPAFFYDNPKSKLLGERLAKFHAAPSFGSMFSVLGT